MSAIASSRTDREHLSGPIAVGVDGSPASRRALEWAVQEAAAKGTKVLAISTYEVPSLVSAAPYAAWSPALKEDLADEAQKVLFSLVKATAETHPEVEIDAQVVEGPAAHVLIEASKHASALVVGSRGHGGMVGALLGSVSHRCVAHAHCPVVVVGPGSPVEEAPVLAAARSAGVNWCPP
ncbi:MAG: universal stress protein [Candidatus Dormiibacterota bacterium]|jgi:nucleotide-binding universal stress UspA family protein